MENKIDFCNVKYPFSDDNEVRGKRILSTVLFFRRGATNDDVIRYVIPLTINILLLGCYFKDLDLTFILYIDEFSYSTLRTQPEFHMLDKFLEYAETVPYVKLARYDCPMFKQDEQYHHNLFGTLIRIIPAFTLPIEMLIVIDADTILHPLQLRIINNWIRSNTGMLIVYPEFRESEGSFASEQKQMIDMFGKVTDSELMIPAYHGCLFGFFALRKTFIPNRLRTTYLRKKIDKYTGKLNKMFSDDYLARLLLSLPDSGDTIMPRSLYNYFMFNLTRDNPLYNSFYTRSYDRLGAVDDKQTTEKYFLYGMDEFILNNIIIYYNFVSSKRRSIYSQPIISYTIIPKKMCPDLYSLVKRELGTVSKVATVPAFIGRDFSLISPLINSCQSTIGDLLQHKPTTLQPMVARILERLTSFGVSADETKLSERYLFNRIIDQYDEPENTNRFNELTLKFLTDNDSCNTRNISPELANNIRVYFFYNRLFVCLGFFNNDRVIRELLSTPDHYSVIPKLTEFPNNRTLWTILNSQFIYHIGISQIIQLVFLGCFSTDCRQLWVNLDALSVMSGFCYSGNREQLAYRDRIFNRLFNIYIDCALVGCLQSDIVSSPLYLQLKNLIFDMIHIEYSIILETVLLYKNTLFDLFPNLTRLSMDEYKKHVQDIIDEYTHCSIYVIDMESRIPSASTLTKLI